MKHQRGSVTHVVAILELAKVLPKMLPADMDMRPGNAAFQLRPEAFDGIDASTQRGRVFTDAMVHLHMAIAGTINVLIPAKLVGVQRRAGDDRAQDSPCIACFVRLLTTRVTSSPPRSSMPRTQVLLPL